jgi:hypothetical protein
MKLLFCPLCSDVRKLNHEMTSCRCKKSWGYYEPDGLNAVYGGVAKILGIANPDIAEAIHHPDHATIRCWMMDPKTAPHIKQLYVKPVKKSSIKKENVI